MNETNHAIAVAQNFIKQTDLNMWHYWAFKEKLTDVMFEDPVDQCDYLHAMRMDISENTDWIIKELEEAEEYELCAAVVKHTRLLRVEALDMEMEVEKQIK